MPEISTFARFKDYLLLALLAGVLSLIGVLHNTAIHRITILETKVENHGDRINAHASRLSTIEAQLSSQMNETFRRLDRMESKLDKLLPLER